MSIIEERNQCSLWHHKGLWFPEWCPFSEKWSKPKKKIVFPPYLISVALTDRLTLTDSGVWLFFHNKRPLKFSSCIVRNVADLERGRQTVKLLNSIKAPQIRAHVYEVKASLCAPCIRSWLDFISFTLRCLMSQHANFVSWWHCKCNVSLSAYTKDNTERADVKETAKTVPRHACKLHQGNYRLLIHPETKPEKQAEKNWRQHPSHRSLNVPWVYIIITRLLQLGQKKCK